MTAVIWIILFSLAQWACKGASSETQPWPQGDATYSFESPDADFELEAALDEISGLTTLPDGTLAAIEDENGDLFVIDPSSGEVVSRTKFGKKGDYEAVEMAGERLFVLRSDGRLYDVGDLNAAELSPRNHDLNVPKDCDAEGLAFDSNRLLVSCKEDPGKKLGKAKAIYGVDLGSMKLSSRPVYTLDPGNFSASASDHPVNDAVRSAVSGKVDLSGFKPSDLAVHPVTGELFIISSVRTAIVVLDRSGNVTRFWMLPEGMLEQPEGITFSLNGDLWIASEAGSRNTARLLRFNYRKGTTNG